MPATSKKQQKFFGIVRSIQKGDAKASEFSKDAQDAAKRISKSDVKKYAKTKHKGLPQKVKKEILSKLKKEYTDGWASPSYYGAASIKRKHDDDNNLGRKKKHSGQPDLEESKFARKPEVTPKQLLKIQNDIRKINRKFRVYISKHPVSKGELNIELGHGHDNDDDIHKIYKVLKRHTGTHHTGRIFNEGWSEKYKKSINCNNPKGFSQKAHCAGKKKNESIAPNHDGKAAPYGSGYEKVDEDGKEISDKNYADYKKDNMNERYRGNIKDFKYDIINALDKVGISPKALKKITKKGKGFEVRMSSYMKNKDAWEKFGKEMGAKLVKFEPGNINIGIYESLNEVGVFPISNYIKDLIPRGRLDITNQRDRERVKALIKDLVYTLNDFWKSHKIPFRVREPRKSDMNRFKKSTKREVSEKSDRDYKKEYKKFQSSKKAKKYRAELNKYNRQKGTYGNGDGKDASHKNGKIVGFESQSKNRGRREKSRLKKNK